MRSNRRNQRESIMNLVPVKKEQHQNIKVATQRNLAHVENQHIVPVTAHEYAQAATSFPVVLVKDPEAEQYRSVAMLGLEAGENLFYSDDKWHAVYVPQSISMIPFGIGLDPEKENTLTTCIDMDSPFIGEDKEQAIFDAEGNESDYYKSVQESLGRQYENEIMTDKFVKELLKHDLLLELELNIALSSGENKKLVGLYGIDEKKLQALSDENILDFHKRGLFVPIHSMLGSIGQINRLAQLRNLSSSEAKVSNIQFKAKEEA